MAVKTENVYGNIVISDEVIGKIAAAEATKCVGVVGMAFKSKADELASILKKDSANKGVKVTSSGNSICLQLHIIAEYGVNLNAISNNIVDAVKYAVESMTGFSVDKVVVQVESVRVSND
ncbi:MAG: Asp23/Gls24 family envelope stress response protein [Clostridia bacterium]|nr:Asp23/Gls24 family envelope stress response protein [Clostridia bacterium]